MMQNDDSDRHSKYYKRACALYRDKLAKCAADDRDFIVDDSWFDELPLTEGHEMLQPNNYAHIKNMNRRYGSQREASAAKEVGNLGAYLAEKIMKIPTCVQETACRDPPC